MSTPSKDAVAIVERPEFRERVRALLLRHGTEVAKAAYPIDGSEGTPEALASFPDTVRAVRRMAGSTEELRDACHHLVGEYPTPLDPSQGGDDLSGAAILQIIEYGIGLWARAEAIE